MVSISSLEKWNGHPFKGFMLKNDIIITISGGKKIILVEFWKMDLIGARVALEKTNLEIIFFLKRYICVKINRDW